MYLARELTDESLPAIGARLRRPRPLHRPARLQASASRSQPIPSLRCGRRARRSALDASDAGRPTVRIRRLSTDSVDSCANSPQSPVSRRLSTSSTAPILLISLDWIFIVKFSTASRKRCSRSSRSSPSRRLDAQRGPDALRRPARRRRAARSSCRPPTWRSASACRSRPRWRARAPSSSPAGCCSTSSRSLPKDAGRRSSTAPRSRTSRSSSGSAKFHLRTLPAEDFPTLPGAGRADDTSSRSPPQAFVETIETRRPRRPRATRRARSSPASSSRRRARSCGWSPPTPIA